MAIDWNLVAQGVSTAGNIYAANRAADAEQDAIRDATGATTAGSSAAIEEIRRQSMQSRADLAPYNAGGQGAFAAYLRAMGVRPTTVTGGAGGGVGTGSVASRFTGINPTGVMPAGAGAAGAIGSVAGGIFGGPAGSAAGQFIGEGIERQGYDWGQLEVINGGNLFTDKRGNKLANAIIEPSLRNMAALVGLAGEGGDLGTGSRVYANSNGVFFDQGGNVIARVKPPAEGMVQVPGLSRNGNPIFLTSEGRIVKQQQSGGGFDDLGFNINDAKEGPLEVNKIIAKGYNPQPATDADFGGTIGIPTGETTGTGLIQEPMTAEDRYGGFLESPGYKFLFDETMRGARAQGSARGGLYSGRMLKELQERATGLASQDFGNYTSRLLAASQLGANAAAGQASTSSNAGANTASILTDTAGTLGNLALGAGQSRASSIANTSSIVSSGIGALADYYGRRSADTGVLSKSGASGPTGGVKGPDYIFRGP